MSPAPTDPELIDVFDELGRHQGVRDRTTVHAEGWWHQVFHLLVVSHRSGGTAVLQRRAVDKASFPGLLDLSATGHLAAGERPVDGLRELREELGIDLDPVSLRPLGIRRIVDETPEGTNREFCHVFLAVDDRPLSGYEPDPREVSAVVELEIEAGLDLFSERVDRVRAVEQAVGEPARSIEIGREHLVPDAPLVDVAGGPADRHGYWLTILAMARRLLDGDDRVAV